MKVFLGVPQTGTATTTTTGKLFHLHRGTTIGRVADSGAKRGAAAATAAPWQRSPGDGACSLRLKRTRRFGEPISSVRFMGMGTRSKEGFKRAQAAPDGISPENPEAVAREQLLEKAKAESAATIDEAQEPFRGAVESGQSIGQATADLQLGAADGKSADEAISDTSKELLKLQQSTTTNGKSGEATEEEDPKAELSSEVWGGKDEEGSTHAFLDDAKKIDFRGDDDESVLGIGGQRAEESGRQED